MSKVSGASGVRVPLTMTLKLALKDDRHLEILKKLEPSFVEFDVVSQNNELNWVFHDHDMPVAQDILNHPCTCSLIVCISANAM